MPDSEPTDPLLIWNRIADYWDNYLGDGNEFQRVLIMPSTDRLLNPQPGQRILDIACGNGNYARQLSRRGCKVLACDGAEAFIAAAKKRTTTADGSIEYLVLDVTSQTGWQQLAGRQFDAAVCSMALMDIASIDLLLRAACDLMKPGGVLVFSLPHPCFSSNNPRMTAELVRDGATARQIFGLHVEKYLTEFADLSMGLLHQPEPHWLWHRPLHVVLNKCFAAGWVMDGIEEPAFPPGSGAKTPFSMERRPDIPPAIVMRLRKPA